MRLSRERVGATEKLGITRAYSLRLEAMSMRLERLARAKPWGAWTSPWEQWGSLESFNQGSDLITLMLWELLSSISMEDALVAWRLESVGSGKRECREWQGKRESSSRNIQILGPHTRNQPNPWKKVPFKALLGRQHVTDFSKPISTVSRDIEKTGNWHVDGKEAARKQGNVALRANSTVRRPRMG